VQSLHFHQESSLHNMPSFQPNADGTLLRIGIVYSRFNEPIVNKMLRACVDALHAHGVKPAHIDQIAVPGALEIPLTLQSLAMTHRYDALIAIGAVIRGETYHFEVVSNDSCRGVMDVMLETGVPIANGILTTENDAQAEARVLEKGGDCARVAIEMANTIAAIHKTKDVR
jgi:6,7-dimethyl-8-ribityllumazine synthase